jgi:hypothetical protein
MLALYKWKGDDHAGDGSFNLESFLADAIPAREKNLRLSHITSPAAKAAHT